MKKVMAVLAVALICAGFYAPVVSAETSTIVIHAKDGQEWGSLNVYNWGDNGETAGVWPGAAMTADADGWYTYTFETEVPLNLVFSAPGGAPQSSNIEGLAVDAKEVWVVIGGAGEANDMGKDTNEAVLYTTAEEGWPTVAVAEEVVEEVVAEEAVTEAVDVPKTGESIALAATFLTIAGISAAGLVLLKKKATA